MDGEKEREIKQDFLKQEIIEKNYSPDDFMEFCEGIKGSNIDSYSLDELKDIVSDFISKKSEPQEISVPETFVEAPIKEKKSSTEFQEPISRKLDENSAYSIPSIQMQDNDLSIEEVIVAKVGM